MSYLLAAFFACFISNFASSLFPRFSFSSLCHLFVQPRMRESSACGTRRLAAEFASATRKSLSLFNVECHFCACCLSGIRAFHPIVCLSFYVITTDFSALSLSLLSLWFPLSTELFLAIFLFILFWLVACLFPLPLSPPPIYLLPISSPVPLLFPTSPDDSSYLIFIGIYDTVHCVC